MKILISEEICFTWNFVGVKRFIDFSFVRKSIKVCEYFEGTIVGT